MIIPKKSLGQNFLIDKNIIKKIINLTDINNNNIIEIGPGLGALTDEILKLSPKKLIIIEKDKNIYDYLIKKYKNKNLQIINDDALNYNYNKIKNFKIISNLPYNISSKFLCKVIKLNKNINEIICMIQSEVADKFNNKNKVNKYSFLTILCSEYKINFSVSKNVFFPKPKVKSKVVSFKINNKINIDVDKLNYFFDFFFTQKRKKLKSNKYFKNNIDDKYINYRYEDLSYSEILEIYHRFNFL